MELVIKKLVVIFLIISSSALYANEFRTGNLPSEYCSQDDSQNYWYLRTPPYIGYSKGERTNAGSDTCVLGFPKKDSKVGYVVVDRKIIKVFPATSSKRENIYLSKDKNTQVHLSITGGDTTCSPNSESCCGEYTYATIKIQQNNQSVIYKAVMYEGG
jgi:hypothetical protein